MRSQREGWLGSWFLAAIVVVAPAVSTTVHAQPGFGPDPFWPYNNQYTPYTEPIGPASPVAGQGNSMIGHPGFVGANQFDNYLEGISGAGRTTTDRAGVGMPYYLSAVDPSYDRRGDRSYEPNRESNSRFEETQRQVSDKYFAYFSERDPRKRAALLRDYQRARRESSRALSPRTQSPSRLLDAASRVRPESGLGNLADDPLRPSPRTRGSAATGRAGIAGTRPGAAGSARGPGRPLRPAPPVPTVAPSRGPRRSRSSPSSVLDRARSMDDRMSRPSGPTSRSRGTVLPSTETPAAPSVPE